MRDLIGHRYVLPLVGALAVVARTDDRGVCPSYAVVLTERDGTVTDMRIAVALLADYLSAHRAVRTDWTGAANG